MQYSFSKKSFARDLFDAAKARLQKPVGFSGMSMLWPGIFHYGRNVALPSRTIDFRALHGGCLQIDSVPFCSRDPGVIGNLPESSTQKAAPAPAASISGNSHGIPFDLFDLGAECDMPTSDRVSPLQGRPSSGATGSPATEEQDAALSAPSRIPTAVISTLLSVAAAIIAGAVIGNTGAFKFDYGNDSGKPPAHLLADAATGDAIGQPASRLTLDATLPASYKAIPEVSLPPQEPRRALPHKPARASRHVRQGQSAALAPRAGAKSRLRKAEANKPKHNAIARAAVAGKAQSMSVAEARQGNAAQSPSSPGTRYARCEQVKGLLRRERCRWDACGDKWGKQGCPAYQSNIPPDFSHGQIGQAGSPQINASGRRHSDG